jgi:hypothetical protein
MDSKKHNFSNYFSSITPNQFFAPTTHNQPMQQELILEKSTYNSNFSKDK